MTHAADNRAKNFQRALDAAVAEHRRGNLAGAIARYEQLLGQRQNDAIVLGNLATALKQGGRREEALACFRRALAADDSMPEAWFNFGNLLQETGATAEAEKAYRRALALDPGLYRAATNLANLLSALKRSDEAIELHRQAIAAAPDNVPSRRALARLLYEKGDLEGAARLYREMLARVPDHADTLNALGVVLKDLGRRDDAIECWQSALKIEPRHSAAHNNLGVMYRLMRQPREAVEHLRKAAQLEPRDAMSAANLAHALIDLGRIGEAEKIASGIIEREPQNAEGYLMRGFALVYQGRVEKAITDFLESHRFAPQSALVISNTLFASLYSERRSAADILVLHRELAERITPALPLRTRWRNSRDAGRRLRIGYLSADFRSHPVTAFFEPVLAHHDKRQFEIYCFSTASASDAVTKRLSAMAGVWRDCQGMNDARLAGQIEADAIDILVDLAGHTAQNRAPVLRSKPAPIQALYIGYPGTSGLPEVDYLIADARVCPAELEHFYTERVMRLDGSFWCFSPPDSAPEPAGLPANKNGYATFGSYNALQKMSAGTVALWARILQTVPHSRLVLKSLAFADAATRRAIRRRFIDAGIDETRVDVVPPSDNSAFLAEYHRLDIALDPFPYNGGTTSCEALWMGVPVVTLAGERFCSRMGMSLLENIGLPELVARSADDYVRIAAALAADLTRLGALRETLRSRMSASPVCDGARTARELERAYRNMWREWLSGTARAQWESVRTCREPFDEAQDTGRSG